MGHIKEPKGIDFVIKSEPLTEEEKTGISEFIKEYKLNASVIKKTVKSGRLSKKEKTINSL